MKIRYIHIIAALTLFALGITSCTYDQTESEATPFVKYVRPTDAKIADSLLVRASMGSTVALIGEGLEGVCEVWFNDQKAKLNPVYVTKTSIVVTIPGSMPDQITNKIYLKTKKGKESDHEFAVIIPSPRVLSISNEWAADGSEVTITGNYFFGDQDNKIKEVLFPGNLSAEIISFTESALTCKVPEGALPGTVTIESIYGKGRSEFTFRESEGIFIDGDNPEVWNTWGRSEFATEGGTSGQYIKLSGETANWQWPGEKLQLVYMNPSETILVPDGDPSEYTLKFEYYCHNWADTWMYLWFTPKQDCNIDDADIAMYTWEPYKTAGGKENHQTNGWVTHSIPLSAFTHNKASGSNDVKISSINDLVNFNIFVFGGAEGNYPFEVWMDNFRIVKIK